MRIIETKIYKIDEHPDKQKCFEWIRNNWHDLNDNSVDKLINSLNALAKKINATCSWSICKVADRGEHITFKDYDVDILSSLNADDFPLTGVYWDAEVIENLRSTSLHKVLDMLHDETEHIYSDEGLNDFCVSNDYEFNEDGRVWR